MDCQWEKYYPIDLCNPSKSTDTAGYNSLLHAIASGIRGITLPGGHKLETTCVVLRPADLILGLLNREELREFESVI